MDHFLAFLINLSNSQQPTTEELDEMVTTEHEDEENTTLELKNVNVTLNETFSVIFKHRSFGKNSS